MRNRNGAFSGHAILAMKKLDLAVMRAVDRG